MKKTIRNTCTVLLIALSIAMLGAACTVEPTQPSNNATPEPESSISDSATPNTEISTTEPIQYKIVETSNVDFGNTSRRLLKAVISEEDSNSASDEQIKELLQTITSEYLKSTPVCAVSVNLYYTENYSGPYNVAKSDYAPYGDWGRANEGNPGKYEDYDYKFSILSKEERKMFGDLASE